MKYICVLSTRDLFLSGVAMGAIAVTEIGAKYGAQDIPALDVTVTHPLQQATVAGAAVTPGHAAEAAYHRKMTDSAEDCDR